MVKRLQRGTAWHILTALLLTLSILNNVKSEEIWKLPTAVDIERSLESCHTTLQSLLQGDDYSNIRCIASALKLWTDEEGFNSKRFAKLLNKHQLPEEILVVVGYCNDHYKQLDLNIWAQEAYYCFARGRMGIWLSEYIRNVYKKKETTLKI
ncbi:hypothetical protein DOY81_001588 [Sarcophaga bullata]|nr:hypothetical protein DOY81_001588 [Sarcophaga bullata]